MTIEVTEAYTGVYEKNRIQGKISKGTKSSSAIVKIYFPDNNKNDLRKEAERIARQAAIEAWEAEYGPIIFWDNMRAQVSHLSIQVVYHLLEWND